MKRLEGIHSVASLTTLLSRRDLIRASAGLFATGAFAGLLVACDDDDTDESPAAAEETATPDDEMDDESEEDPEDEDADEDDDTTDDSSDSSAPEHLTIATDSDPETLDGTLRTVANHRRVYGLIYDPLVHVDPEGNIVPKLAESWELADDTHWVFELRDDVIFHNGDEFDAEAAKFSLDRAGDPSISQSASKLTPIAEVNVVDSHTLEIVTDGPSPTLLSGSLADWVFIVPPSVYESEGEDFQSATPYGTGPYAFREWSRGDRLTLDANEDYWGGEVPVKEVILRPIPEVATRVSSLLAGELDIAVDLPPSQLDRVDNSDVARVSSAPGPMSIGVRLKLERDTPLQDVRVRQALNYAVDKQGIIDQLLFGQATLLKGQPLYDGMVGFNPDLEAYAYDPDRARELLEEAGYEDGFTLPMDVPIGGVPDGPEIAQAILSNLHDVGVSVELNQIEWQAYLERLFTPGSEAMSDSFLLYINAPSRDGDEILNLEFRCDGEYPDGWNWIQYCNEEVDELITLQKRTFDEAEREVAMQRAAEIIGEEAPWIFLHNPNVNFGVKEGIIWEARSDSLLAIWDVYH